MLCVTTTRATPMLTELTTIVAAPRPKMVAPDATSALPSAALPAIAAAVRCLLQLLRLLLLARLRLPLLGGDTGNH